MFASSSRDGSGSGGRAGRPLTRKLWICSSSVGAAVSLSKILNPKMSPDGSSGTDWMVCVWDTAFTSAEWMVCEWVHVACTVKCFEWLTRLKKQWSYFHSILYGAYTFTLFSFSRKWSIAKQHYNSKWLADRFGLYQTDHTNSVFDETMIEE